MKTLTLSTIAAVAFVLSAGTALAGNGAGKTHDDGFDVFLQSQGQDAGSRSFLSGSEGYGDAYRPHVPARERRFLASEGEYPIGTDNGFAVYMQDQRVTPQRGFLSSEPTYPIGTDNGFAVYMDDLKRTGH